LQHPPTSLLTVARFFFLFDRFFLQIAPTPWFRFALFCSFLISQAAFPSTTPFADSPPPLRFRSGWPPPRFFPCHSLCFPVCRGHVTFFSPARSHRLGARARAACPSMTRVKEPFCKRRRRIRAPSLLFALWPPLQARGENVLWHLRVDFILLAIAILQAYVQEFLCGGPTWGFGIRIV